MSFLDYEGFKYFYGKLKSLIDGKAKKEDIKTKLSEMTSDSNNRLVTDVEKTKLSNLKEQVILTESEYEALSSAQKNDEGKIYFIKE